MGTTGSQDSKEMFAFTEDEVMNQREVDAAVAALEDEFNGQDACPSYSQMSEYERRTKMIQEEFDAAAASDEVEEICGTPPSEMKMVAMKTPKVPQRKVYRARDFEIGS